ncbi:AAA family ATPase [Microvirga sp. 2YAF29]|uniref:ATP-binding protein n=1 Tax=Microvirga sp. 2YAF29 TaxID=3233031 RepID=UPI003F94DB9D
MPQHVPPAHSLGTADRRQVTALAYDLVGSTRLAERLDPEDMHTLLQSFHAMCTAAIEETGGKVNRYIGDGGMAYFGYPTAYENAAERAIHAGLAIVKGCAQLGVTVSGSRHALSVRVGIATSKVVAGNMTGERGFGADEVVGIAPHLAARLQAAAAPGSVLVSNATHRLVGTMFRFGGIHELELPGFTHLQQAWTVLRARHPQTRFEGLHSRGVTPFLERKAEFAELTDKWRLARSGQGQAVILIGDPGIGKSRVAAEIRTVLAHEAATALSLQCSPLHALTPLYPIRSLLERRYLNNTDERQGSTEKGLSRLLNMPVLSFPEAAPVLNHILFSFQDEADFGQGPRSTEQLKEEAFATLIEIVARLAKRGPLLIIFEDTHWIDPSSSELLNRLIVRITDLPVLLLMTGRPVDSVLQQADSENVTRIDLSPLGEEAATALIKHVAGAAPLELKELRHILNRAEGNPFFLEELTVELLNRDRDFDDASSLPTSLQDILASRLDQSTLGKQIAQTASAIGRTFPADLLRQATRLDERDVNSGLDRLYELGVITLEQEVPQRSYSFRHALLQQSAYDSMLKTTRQAVHRQLAQVLETAYAEPEILARHFTEAGLPREAIDKLQQAGKRAASRSANLEAISLFRRALSLASELEPGQDRTEIELDIYLALAPLLISLAGPGAEEVQGLYRQAIALSDSIHDYRRFTAYWGWWRTASNFKSMRERADQLSIIVQDLSDPHLSLQAHHCQWATLFMLGEQRRCCEHVAEGLALYDAVEHRHDAILYGGHDPKVCGLGEKALSLWIQGFSRRSQAAIKACARHAAALDHRASKTHFEEAEINLLRYRRDIEAVKQRAMRMHRFADELGFKDIAAKAEIFGGWAVALSGRHDEGIVEIERGLATQRLIGTQEDFPAYLEMLAEAYGLAGRFSRGLEVIEEATQIVDETNLRYWLAELLRRRGELFFFLGRNDEALRCYDEAVSTAESQNANALCLRVAISSSPVFVESGLHHDAVARLEKAIANLPEAAPTADRSLAVNLLKRLREAA